MRAALTIFAIGFSLVSSTACTTVVGERSFIRPDSLSGFKSEQVFNASKLPPSATIDEPSIKTEDGITLKGLNLHQPDAVATVLYFGGNMFHIDEDAKAILPVIAACGVNVAVFDYRGYGRSQGQPTVANMRSDALRIFDLVNAQTPGKVIVHGQSLGSFMAAYVAQQRPALGMVLESTANNVQDWANANIPWYVRPFISIEVSDTLRDADNVAAVSKFTGDSLVMVGEQDKITPPKLGLKVFAAIPAASKQMLMIAGVGHNGALENRNAAPAYCDFLAKLAEKP